MQPLSDHFTNVPAFLTKLWKMVSDSKTDHLICWSPNGNSFIILNQVQFWYELLPLYYKHNNMSSFVRQLNMYGFHKVSAVENGPIADGEKDEVQFFHPYFKKESPELLKLIKRKVTVSKHSENGNQVMKSEDLSKVLSDVKQLRGRQAHVDSQLATMKQENAVLWRELAVLRQKHTKQQQILIQFLVSMVHPGGNRMGVGVKRHYPLMLRGTPNKRMKKSPSSKNDGPTIHELDNEIEIENEVEPEEFLTASDNDEKDLTLIYKPLTPTSTSSLDVVSPLSNIDLTNELVNETETVSADTSSNAKETTSQNKSKESYWEKSPYVVEQFADNSEEGMPSNELLSEDPILNILEDNIIKPKSGDNETKVFINPSSQDTLLGNFTNRDFNIKVVNGKKDRSQSSSAKSSNEVEETPDNSSVNDNMTVATRKTEGPEKINNSTDDCFSGDLGSILENNQSEIDLYKDLLHGCGTFDTNTLLGDINRMPFYQPDYSLFSEGTSEYGLSFTQDELNQNSGDPMVSGQEITTYPMLPLEQLLDDSLNNTDLVDEIIDDDLSELNTPQVSDMKPTFPTDKS
ncbi:heat shock factor protein isoform X2 [Coccinella septempunctata]|uniref:heat shock factor protein isoform X2 n=1 Tax=Coccinella septempunctata TaxID=41139 RepID=UPI001D060996|nr:heat shock factor protein isoform X2 [Coccinella septempunctata]